CDIGGQRWTMSANPRPKLLCPSGDRSVQWLARLARWILLLCSAPGRPRLATSSQFEWKSQYPALPTAARSAYGQESSSSLGSIPSFLTKRDRRSQMRASPWLRLYFQVHVINLKRGD